MPWTYARHPDPLWGIVHCRGDGDVAVPGDGPERPRPAGGEFTVHQDPAGPAAGNVPGELAAVPSDVGDPILPRALRADFAYLTEVRAHVVHEGLRVVAHTRAAVLGADENEAVVAQTRRHE